jgi:hypothetical protein
VDGWGLFFLLAYASAEWLILLFLLLFSLYSRLGPSWVAGNRYQVAKSRFGLQGCPVCSIRLLRGRTIWGGVGGGG